MNIKNNIIKNKIDETQEPNYNKRLQFDDLLSYAKKTKKLVDKNFLKKNGFNSLEADWFLENRKQDITDINEIINPEFNKSEFDKLGLNKSKTTKSKTKKSKITKLIRENEQLRKRIKELEAEKSTDSKSKKYKYYCIKTNKEWIIRSFNPKTNKYGTLGTVKKDYVNDMYKLLQFLTSAENPNTTYRQIVQSLIVQKNLDISVDAFNGGQNRGRYFFPYYYYPIKVLEHFGVIEHKTHGKFVVKKHDLYEEEERQIFY